MCLPLLGTVELSEKFINFFNWARLQLSSLQVSSTFLNMSQVVFILLVADLAVGVVLVRHRFLNIIVVYGLIVQVSRKVTLQVFLVFSEARLFYFFEVFRHPALFRLVYNGTETVGSHHVQGVQVILGLETLASSLARVEALAHEARRRTALMRCVGDLCLRHSHLVATFCRTNVITAD